MSRRRKVWGSIAAGVGLAAAGTTVGMLRQKRSISRRAGEGVAFGSLRSEPVTVRTDDGVDLHVEVDEVDPVLVGVRSVWRGHGATPGVTVIFAHGYCLNLDCWHFQRAGYRNLVRTVYYDQRSHGRSGQGSSEHANIDQLGRDLKRVIDEVAPDSPVVLVGHSMGGMSIIALVEQFPELIGDKVIGVGLVATTAGGLDPGRVLLPMLPARLSTPAMRGTVAGLRRGRGLVDTFRRVGAGVATVLVDRFAFGSDVPESYVEFVDEMLSATPFEVVADFFPSFDALDKFDAVEVLGRVPTAIICGTDDKLTSIGHSRRLHARIPGARLVECEGAGHMVILEQHDRVNAELDQLITSAVTTEASR